MLIVHCEISDIIELWNKNKEIMSEDVLYRSADREMDSIKKFFSKLWDWYNIKFLIWGDIN